MQPMLAGKFVERHIEKLLPMYGQLKLDGIRGFTHNGYAKTRSLKPVRSTQVQSIIAHNKDFLEGLDYEMVCGDPTAPNCYNRTDSSVMSFGKPDEDLHFYVFDMWDSVDRYEERLQQLQELDFSKIDGGGQGRFTVLETKLLWTMKDVYEYRDEQISLGHEGIMLRSPNGYYKFGRGTPTEGQLIKVKDGRWVVTEARITGYKELMSNQNEATENLLGRTERSGHRENLVPQGVLGAFTGEGIFPEEDSLDKSLWGKFFETSVGGGMDDTQRIDFWNRRDELIGQTMKFKFFTGGIKERPRFTAFVGFRDTDDMDPPKQMELF